MGVYTNFVKEKREEIYPSNVENVVKNEDYAMHDGEKFIRFRG